MAQPIRGTVVDGSAGSPVASALVQLISVDSAVLAAALTNDAGRFVIERPDVPTLRLRIAQLGYEEKWVDLQAATDSVTVLLQPRPVEVGAISVEADRPSRWLQAAGFYDRQRLGLGTFITREQIEDRYRTARRTGDILRTITRLKIEEDANQEVVLVRSSLDPQGRPCRAAVFIQGVSVGRAVPRMHPDDIEAIEVYAGVSQIPAQYAGSEAGCGIVLIWLRTG